jgi:hypothetical protein
VWKTTDQCADDASIPPDMHSVSAPLRAQYDLYCPLGGHDAAGQKLLFTVSG